MWTKIPEEQGLEGRLFVKTEVQVHFIFDLTEDIGTIPLPKSFCILVLTVSIVNRNFFFSEGILYSYNQIISDCDHPINSAHAPKQNIFFRHMISNQLYPILLCPPSPLYINGNMRTPETTVQEAAFHFYEDF